MVRVKKWLLVALLFASEQAWATTTLTKYVNTSCTFNGDGTSNSCAASNGVAGAYTSISNTEVANRQNLVTGDKILQILVDGNAADTTAVTFASTNWTTDATRYVFITPNTGSIHNGIYSTSIYRYEPIGGNGLLVDGVYVRLQGLQAGATSTGSAVFYVYGANSITSELRVTECIIRGTEVTPTRHGIKVLVDTGGSNRTIVAVNNIFYGLKDSMFIDIADGSKAVIYNNTMIGATGVNLEMADNNWVAVNPVWYVKNNILKGGVIGDYGNFTAHSTITTAKNFTSNASSPDSLGSKTFTFVNAGSNDYHISLSDISGVIAGGNDLSADTQYAFSTDIDSQTRIAPWEAGADELVIVSTVHLLLSTGVGQ